MANEFAPSVAHIRVYAELNDLVAPERRGHTFDHAFRGTPSIKDVVESLGIPHTEVDLILVDGEPVDFAWRLQDGARVSLYPVFESLDITSPARLRPEPLRAIRFVADVHLGRLVRHLRMLGFDTSWSPDAADEELARVSIEERRVLLTRDRGLLKRRAVTHGCLVHAFNPWDQLVEIVRRLDLVRAFRPFTRCLRCNGLLILVAKETVLDGLPPSVRERHDEFRRCASCARVYWAGTHHARMQRLVERLTAELGEPQPS